MYKVYQRPAGMIIFSIDIILRYISSKVLACNVSILCTFDSVIIGINCIWALMKHQNAFTELTL